MNFDILCELLDYNYTMQVCTDLLMNAEFNFPIADNKNIRKIIQPARQTCGQGYIFCLH